jgi:hypothetical protein
VNQYTFNDALYAIIRETPGNQKVNMLAAQSAIEIKTGQSTFGQWSTLVDNFASLYPISARRLRRRTFGRRAKRTTNWSRTAIAYMRKQQATWKRLTDELKETTDRVDVAILKVRAGLHFNANFNHPLAQILSLTVPSKRHLLRVGRSAA